MKPHFADSFRAPSLIVLATFALAMCASADERPRLDAVRAAKIASDYLASQGANGPFVVSVTLEKSALLHGESSWVARWSRAISADGDQEVGLRVNLDGTTARLVLGKEAARKRKAGPSGAR